MNPVFRTILLPCEDNMAWVVLAVNALDHTGWSDVGCKQVLKRTMTCLQCALANGVGTAPLRMTAIYGSWWSCPSSARHLAERSRDRHAVMQLTDGRS
jgi:hypothetical protein